MWQNIAVCLIGLFVALYVGRQIYLMVKEPHKNRCGCGCKECMEKHKKNNSKSCK